jgi:hypothetical protein
MPTAEFQYVEPDDQEYYINLEVSTPYENQKLLTLTEQINGALDQHDVAEALRRLADKVEGISK